MVVPQGQDWQRRRPSSTALALLGLLGLAALSDGAAWVSQFSRRSVLGGALASGIFAAQDAHAQDAEEVKRMRRLSDPPEVVAKREAFLEKEAARLEVVKQDFKETFKGLAAEDASIETRVELMGKLQGLVEQERRLPEGITRNDVVKGIRAVKYNIGCVKTSVKQGDCKQIEKAYMKLIAGIDKVSDKGIVQPR